MSHHRSRWSLAALPLVLIAGAVVGTGPVSGSPSGAAPPPPTGDSRVEPFGAHDHHDVDARGDVDPLASQRSAARALDATLRWNRFGTPSSILPVDGLLGPRTDSSPTATARKWLLANNRLLGLSTSEVADLELLSNQRLDRRKGNAGYAVLYRQRFGDLPAALDGLVTVGVGPNGVAYVSSSLSRETSAPSTTDAIGAGEAWLTAADALDVRETGIGELRELAPRLGGWTAFEVDGIPQTQQVRLRAIALPGEGTRAVYETNVVRVMGAEALGFTSYVDATTGEILVSHNRGHDLINDLDVPAAAAPTASVAAPAAAPTGPTPFNGAITASGCGPDHDFTVPEGQASAVAAATAAVPTNDIIVKILFEGAVVASSDTGTSPEVATYAPAGGLPVGEYTVQVCPFNPPTVPFLEPGDYAGVFATSDVDPPEAGLPEVSWDAYLSNPRLDFSPTRGGGPRERVCWVRIPERGCTKPPGPVANPAARAPWDVDPSTGVPTFTTSGNAAVTAEAWTTPLTPGPFGQRPVAPDRNYDDEFTDVWNNSGCDPAQLVPGGNDIMAATTNLFVGHNRMHDYSYFLGFDERNYNMQVSNFGAGGIGGDPEVGNVQAGAISGGAPSYLGRDNANQITLQDGIPGITNQYLFQPIAGAFYSPCADGSLDASIYAHEYTHAITNRMVAGPDAGPVRGPGRGHGGVVERPGRDGVPVRPLLRLRRQQPVGRRRVRHRQQGHRHPQLRDEPQPAALR